MTYLLNKIVGGLLNPFAIGIGLIGLSVLLVFLSNGGKTRRLRRWGVGVGIFAFLWFWIWGTQVMMMLFALPLEEEFPVTRVEDLPRGDAIVVLGGGMGANTNVYPYAEMWGGADRVWHAARLYKAGKAPLVIPTGMGEEASTVPLLLDLGVPRTAILVEPDARNTEENARCIVRLLDCSDCSIGRRANQEAGISTPPISQSPNRPIDQSNNPPIPQISQSTNLPIEQSPNRTIEQSTNRTILLVTSAWHMRRALLMYRKYAPQLEIIPAATDYEALVNSSSFHLIDLLPSYDRFLRNCVAFKEYVGYWGYRLFRR